MVDAFEEAGLPVFGPTRKAAELEGSKAFAKDFMRLANVPTADYAVFDDAAAAAAHVEERTERPLVVKADGLAAGKGVTVCPTRQAALAAIRHMMVEQSFGEAGKRIVIEECLAGQEASILAIVDGSTIVPLEPAQDHKPAYDDDKGPNTGGMGAYSPTPLVTPQLLDEIIEKVLVPTVHTMKREGRPFRGILYAGVMITTQGPEGARVQRPLRRSRGPARLDAAQERSGRSPPGGGGRPPQKAGSARMGPAPGRLRGDGGRRLSRPVQKGAARSADWTRRHEFPR